MPIGSGRVLEELRKFGLTFPGAVSKSPWPGHDDLAVKDKTFAYLSAAGEPFSASFKLPYTGFKVLQLPYASPTGYGLGKSGWVTLTPPEGELPSLGELKEWLEEGYRAQAPKSFVKLLDA